MSTHTADFNRAASRRSGFTIVEMLMALAVSALIATTVLMLLTAMSNATRDQANTRRAIVTRQVAAVRIGAMLRSAAMTLSADTHHLVLWTGDRNRNAKPDLSELRRLDWNADNEIQLYEAPEDMSTLSDITYELTDDFDAITASLQATTDFPGQLLIRHVTDCDFSLDDPVTANARLIRLQITLADQPANSNVIIAALKGDKP